MENSYSITVTNKFSLALDEDEDPLELLKVREQEKEAKKKEKLSEKENKSKQPEAQKPAGNKPPKARVIKDNTENPKQQKVQEPKKEPAEKKPSQQRSGGGDRNVKFSGESREDYNNRRNREDTDRPPRGHGGDVRRGPPSGEGRDNREFRNRDSGDGPRGDFGERRGGRGGGGGGLRGIGSGGPRGGSRGGSRGARSGFDSRGKREFDRQSGSDKTQTRHAYSGVKPVDKKDGAGSHNWGTHNDEIEEGLNTENQDWNNEKTDGETPNAPTEVKEGETPAADTSAEEKPAEEETKELTFDEWKALRGARAKPTYNLRKAGEGEDLTRWKKMYALEKKKEGAEEDDEEEEDYDVTVEYPQRVGRQKRVYDIEIQFTDSRRGGGGRGNRSGRGARGDRQNGRGFGNRGTPRGEGPPEPRPAPETAVKAVAGPAVEQRSPRGRQNAPKVDDEHDFPSLG